MALDEEMMEPEDNEQEESSEDEMDLKIAVLLGQKLLEEGGLDVVEKAVRGSSDPGQVIGQFLMQMGQQLHESMPDDAKLSPAIMLAPGGWVEQMSDYIQEAAGVKKDIMDKAEIYVASTAQQMAQAKQAQGDPNAPPVAPGVQAPVMPQQAGPVMPQPAGAM
jgi:hypothetical protein